MEQITGPSDENLYVDRQAGKHGKSGPFHVVYASDRTTRWGFFCSNCETIVTAVGSMGRVHCSGCGNRSSPEDWDAAQL